MDHQPASGVNSVEQLLRRQGRAARSRDALRRTSSVAAWPMAMAGSVLISNSAAHSAVRLWVAWLFLMSSFVAMIAMFGWRAARMLSSRIPPWTSSPRVARWGVWAAAAVASIAAGLAASTAPLAALIFWAVAVIALVMLRSREREFDRQVEQLGHEVLVVVGYR